MTEQSPDIWHNGRIVPWDEARLHVSTQCVIKGINVFEGVRAYWDDETSDLLIFRLEDHLRRLEDVSMKLLHMELPAGFDLRQATVDVLRTNEFRENVHIRIVVYFGEGSDAAYLPGEIETGAFILPRARGSHPKHDNGIRCTVSPWRRLSDVVQPPRIKAGANYLNARIAAVDARKKGADIPLMLNDHGEVAEAPNACVFIVRGGVPVTPPVTASILESVTRATLLELMAEQLGLQPVERPVGLSELYVADEVFLCGTGVEILPVTDIDGYIIGDGEPGQITKAVMGAYDDLVYGRDAAGRAWLTSVYAEGA